MLQNYPVETDPSPHVEPIRAGDFKVVCDNMTQGLGKMLRKCGVDTVILDNVDEHDVCVRLAQRDHRMIITKGHVFYRVSIYHHVRFL